MCSISIEKLYVWASRYTRLVRPICVTEKEPARVRYQYNSSTCPLKACSDGCITRSRCRTTRSVWSRRIPVSYVMAYSVVCFCVCVCVCVLSLFVSKHFLTTALYIGRYQRMLQLLDDSLHETFHVSLLLMLLLFVWR